MAGRTLTDFQRVPRNCSCTNIQTSVGRRRIAIATMNSADPNSHQKQSRVLHSLRQGRDHALANSVRIANNWDKNREPQRSGRINHGLCNRAQYNLVGKKSTMDIKTAAAASVLAAVIGLGASAHSAGAYSLSPQNSSFTATGQGTVSENGGSYECTVNLTGTTAVTTGSITGVALSGPAGCENVVGKGLPWSFAVISGKQIQITHFDLHYPGLGFCGPSKVNAKITNGNIGIKHHVPNKNGICKIEALLNTSPALSIAAN